MKVQSESNAIGRFIAVPVAALILFAPVEALAVKKVCKNDVCSRTTWDGRRVTIYFGSDGPSLASHFNFKGNNAEGITGQQIELRTGPLTSCIEITERESPAVVGALYREQVARFSVETIHGELLPSAQLESGFSKRFEENWYTDASETTSVTGRVSIPLLANGEVQARLRQAKHTHVQRLQEIEQARTEQVAQVTSAWAQLQAAQAALESDRTAVEANEIALRGVREEERVRQRTLLDVLNAEQELLNAKVTLVTDRRNHLVASYTLLSAIGRLNAQELALGGSIYDAEGHYREVRSKWFDLSISYEAR